MGRFENTIFFFTTATMAQLTPEFEVLSIALETSPSMGQPCGLDVSLRCITPKGLGKLTTLPSSRWCPMIKVGLFLKVC